MLRAIAEGETDPAQLAALADERLRATSEQLCDALGACTELNPVCRRLISMALEELRLIDEQISRLDRELAGLLKAHQDAVERLAEVPGLRGRLSAADHCRSRPDRCCLLPLRSVFPLGSVSARAAMRQRASTTATAHPKAIVTCDAYSIRLRMPEQGICRKQVLGGS
jgi:hypothetical protein